MSGDDKDVEQPRVPLRDVFRARLEASGGSSPEAFIATLDELDQRMATIAAEIEHNGETFEALVNWYSDVSRILKDLPGSSRQAVMEGLNQALPQQVNRIENKATEGARIGSAPSRDALEALWEAADDYRARRQRLARQASLGLPVAFLGAVVAGVLFTSLIIPSLPSSWQWPCAITGLDFRQSADTDSKTTFCVLKRP